MPQRLAVTVRSKEPRVRFAEELRRLRTEHGLSLRDLAKAVGWDASQFSKMESGQTLGGPEVVQALDQYYGTPGLLVTLWRYPLREDRDHLPGRTSHRRHLPLVRPMIRTKPPSTGSGRPTGVPRHPL